MVGLADAAAVPGLDQPGPAAGLAPPAGAALAGGGGASGHRPAARFGVGQVLAVLGADGPTGHQ